MTAPVVILQGDCLQLLAGLAERSVDTVCLDPPFGTQRRFGGPGGGFSDVWRRDAEAERWLAHLAAARPATAALLEASRPKPGLLAFLAWGACLALELRRVLRPAGTLWWHCDDVAAAHLGIVLDGVFGWRQRLGVVVWKRTSAHNGSKRRLGRIHDSILCYGRSRAACHRMAGLRGRDDAAELAHGDPLDGFFVEALLDDRLPRRGGERILWPTQKPVALVRRLIRASTRPGELVLDPTCGSGTALVAAVAERRRAIGIEISAEAVAIARRRLGPAVAPAPAAAPAGEAAA